MRTLYISYFLVLAAGIPAKSQDWFRELLAQVPTLQLPKSAALKSATGTQLSHNQYNEKIGRQPGFIRKDGQLVEEVIYGEIDLNSPIRGLELPTVSVIGKLTVSSNINLLIIKIEPDPKLKSAPVLQVCSFDLSNKYCSGLMLSGGEIESYSGEILKDKILQTISGEGERTRNTFVLSNDGYFELVNSVRTEK
jgi:hypothetical protein